MFTETEDGPKRPAGWVIGVGVAAVLVLLGGLLAIRHAHTGESAEALKPVDPAAKVLTLSGIQLSEAGHGTGTNSLYVDGQVQNGGTQTLTGLTVQAVFHDANGGASMQTVPLTLVRIREPYVDLEPIAAEPVKPGEAKDFRLIFEAVPQNWDVKAPELRLVHTRFQ